MSTEEQEAACRVRRERHAVMIPEQQHAQCERNQQQASNRSSQSVPLHLDHPDVIQRIEAFHRNLSCLQNVFCNVRSGFLQLPLMN